MKSTACLSAAVESTPKSFPVKTWPVKSLPGKKGLNFLPPRCILHNVGHPGGNAESLIFPDKLQRDELSPIHVSLGKSFSQYLVTFRVSWGSPLHEK